MSNRILTIILSLLFGAVTAPALLAQESWIGASDVTFKGHSTLHDFTGTIHAVPLKAIVTPGKGERIVSATSNLQVRQMTTRNQDRDQNMMTMFHESQHPLIALEVIEAGEKSLKPPGGRPGAMTIFLTIIAKRNPVSAAVTNVQEAPDSVSFDLTFPVSLKAFNLDPPTALGGMMKVQDTIEVAAHVHLHKKSQ